MVGFACGAVAQSVRWGERLIGFQLVFNKTHNNDGKSRASTATHSLLPSLSLSLRARSPHLILYMLSSCPKPHNTYPFGLGVMLTKKSGFFALKFITCQSSGCQSTIFIYALCAYSIWIFVMQFVVAHASPQAKRTAQNDHRLLENDMINKLFLVHIHFRISEKHICIVLRKLATSLCHGSGPMQRLHAPTAIEWIASSVCRQSQWKWTMNTATHRLPHWQP